MWAPHKICCRTSLCRGGGGEGAAGCTRAATRQGLGSGPTGEGAGGCRMVVVWCHRRLPRALCVCAIPGLGAKAMRSAPQPRPFGPQPAQLYWEYRQVSTNCASARHRYATPGLCALLDPLLCFPHLPPCPHRPARSGLASWLHWSLLPAGLLAPGDRPCRVRALALLRGCVEAGSAPAVAGWGRREWEAAADLLHVLVGGVVGCRWCV